MLPIQLLFLALIYEIASMSLPWDDIDKEYLYLPKKWAASSIQKFMVWFGPASSIFDVATFIVTFFIIAPSIAGGQFVNLNEDQQELFIAIFQSSWFIVSLWTQTLVLYTLRTPKIPFIQSRPSNVVLSITGIGILIGTFAPYTGLGHALGLAALPIQFWGLLAVTVVLYLILVQIVKHIYVKRHGELL